MAWVAIDVAAVLALTTLVGLAFLPVYATWVLFLSLFGFTIAGIALALLAAIRGWSPSVTVLVAIAVWFVLGSALTMPEQSLFRVIPTPRTLFGLVSGPVTAWREMLTLDPPIGETANLLVVPGMTGLLIGMISLALSLRSTLPTLAWVPSAVGYVLAAALGASVTHWPLLVGVAFFVIVLVWTTYRREVIGTRLSETPGGMKFGRLALGAALLVATTLGGVLLGQLALGATGRETLRENVPIPIDLAKQRSPLQGFRANHAKYREQALLEVSGARAGDIVRIATLDAYDGVAFRVGTLDDDALDETTFRRVGQWIAEPEKGTEATIKVRILSYSDVWVPTIGRLRSIRFAGERPVELQEGFYYNHSSATGVVLSGVRPQDSYTMDVVLPSRPSDDEIAKAEAGELAQPNLQNVPEQARSLARLWTDGLTGAGQQALELEKRLKEGYFSHGIDDDVLSLAGHSQSRLSTLLDTPDFMVGDHEQYAATMTLMARSLGIPARIIYGYQLGDSEQILGSQAGAWPELYFDELGWVRFDPTPPEARKPERHERPQPPEVNPPVDAPPPPPKPVEAVPPDDPLQINSGEPPQEEGAINWATVGTVALITGVPLLTIVVPILLILGLKHRRLVRRRNDPDTANRVAGAWLELVDKARDLGKSPSVSATRSEQAEQFGEDFPRLAQNADAIDLAKEADWLVFAPGSPDQGVVQDYWQAVKAVRRGMRQSVSLPRWVISALSTKSFRNIK